MVVGQVKTEEKPDKTEEAPKEQINKKKSAWTEERKKKQALRMMKVIAEGKAYTGKNKDVSVPGDKEPEIIETIPVAEEIRNTKGANIVSIIIIIFALIVAGILFMKSKIQNNEVNNEQ